MRTHTKIGGWYFPTKLGGRFALVDHLHRAFEARYGKKFVASMTADTLKSILAETHMIFIIDGTEKRLQWSTSTTSKDDSVARP